MTFEQNNNQPNLLIPPVELADLWAKILKLDDVDQNISFFDAGGTSLDAVELLEEIKLKFNLEVGLDVLFRAPILSEFQHEISFLNPEPVKSGKRFKPLEIHDSAQSFFAIAHTCTLGETTSTYYFEGIYNQIHESDKILNRETITAVVNECVEDIRILNGRRPVLLQGYCHGGWLTLAVAQRLHELGENVAYMGLVEVYPRRRFFKGGQFAEFFGEWVNTFRCLLRDGRFRTCLLLSKNLVSNEIWRQLAKRLKVDDTPGTGFQRRLRHVANIEAYRNFEREVFWKGWNKPVTLYIQTEETGDRKIQKALHGYDKVFRAGYDVVKVAGDHNSIRHSRGSESLSANVQNQLNKSGWESDKTA